MKSKLILTFFLIIIINTAKGQISIEECYTNALNNYPLIKQYALIEKTGNYNIENASKAYLPQFSITAKATYQSDVIELPINLPSINLGGLSKDQYQAVAEVNQIIWDGGNIKAVNQINKATTEVEKQKLENELFAIKERINQLYFGILLINEQISQNKILQTDLEINYKRIVAGIENGVANQNDLNIIKVEQLNVIQKQKELISSKKSYLEMLSFFTGVNLDENAILLKPQLVQEQINTSENNRPELKYFESQNMLLDSKLSAINASNRPKLGLFFQSGYGRPALNMLKNEFSPFYIGGLRLSWNFGNLYTSNNNKSLININKEATNIQKKIFLFNNNIKAMQIKNEIEKYKSLLETDEEIIQLRKSIKKISEVKFENGTLSASELIRDINSENLARQIKALHEIQYINSIYNLKTNFNL